MSWPKIHFQDTTCTLTDPELLGDALQQMEDRGVPFLNWICNGRKISLDALRDFPHTRNLRIDGGRIADIRHLYVCRQLESLALADCTYGGTLDLAPIGEKLTNLVVHPCAKIKALDTCIALDRLWIGNYKNKQNLGDLGLGQSLAALKRVELMTSTFEDFTYFDLPSVEFVSLYRCGSVSSLRGIEQLHSLTTLHITTKTRIVDYDALLHCQNLERLFIAGQNEVADLEFVPGLKNLKQLFVEGNIQSGDMAPLLRSTSLQKIHVANKPAYTHTREEIRLALGLGDSEMPVSG